MVLLRKEGEGNVRGSFDVPSESTQRGLGTGIGFPQAWVELCWRIRKDENLIDFGKSFWVLEVRMTVPLGEADETEWEVIYRMGTKKQVQGVFSFHP